MKSLRRDRPEALRSAPCGALLVLALSLPLPAAAACGDAARLSARLDADAVLLTWAGGLDAGDDWVVYNPSRAELEADVPGSVLFTGTENEYLHPAAAEIFYRVRCEGPGGAGPWSNMAFRIELNLFSSASVEYPANHLVSLPLEWNPPDVAGGADSWPCDDAGDGEATLDEALCELWTSVDALSDARFTVEALDRSLEAFVARVGERVGGGPPGASGSTAPLSDTVGAGAALSVRVEGDVADNPVVIVGSHDPDFGGYLLSSPADRGSFHLLSVPYHTRYRTADEILCGIRDEDWYELDGDGIPDSCPNGVFDPVSGGHATVARIQNDPITGAATMGRQVFDSGSLLFVGSNFDLVPGEGIIVYLPRGYAERPFLPPTY